MSTNTVNPIHANLNTTDKASALATSAIADLASKLEAGRSDALTAYLRFLGRFHRYSALNVLLIHVQNPEATHVAGYGRWQELNRQVRRGEKGIAILAPCTFKRKNEDREEDEREVVTGFRTAYVFDVSQTDGDALPSLGTVEGDPGYQLAALQSLVGELGIKLECADILGGARGMSCGNRIVLLRGMPKAEEFSTLVHELAHELLHRGERRAETNVRMRELEAEAVAFVVTSTIGLENRTASSDYIQLYGGDAKALAQSLQHVQRISSEILTYLL